MPGKCQSSLFEGGLKSSGGSFPGSVVGREGEISLFLTRAVKVVAHGYAQENCCSLV